MADHSARNKMLSSNLALVFGPTLLRPQGDDPVRELADNPHQRTVAARHGRARITAAGRASAD